MLIEVKPTFQAPPKAAAIGRFADQAAQRRDPREARTNVGVARSRNRAGPRSQGAAALRPNQSHRFPGARGGGQHKIPQLVTMES